MRGATPNAADERNAPHGAPIHDTAGAIGHRYKKYTRHMTQRQSNIYNTTADRGREAEGTAKLSSRRSNTNLRETTTWKTQNNDEGDEHLDSEKMCGVHTVGGQVSRAHTENDRKK
jgi:hypothetical protein